jgi:hypothetical protein
MIFDLLAAPYQEQYSSFTRTPKEGLPPDGYVHHCTLDCRVFGHLHSVDVFRVPFYSQAKWLVRSSVRSTGTGELWRGHRNGCRVDRPR